MDTKKPGKQGTKGSKQIVEENKGTLKFYLQMIVGSSVAYFVLRLLAAFVFSSQITTTQMFLVLLCIGAQIGSFKFLQMMARPKLSDSGAILDSGTDLCMEGGIAEHVKDIIILCVAVELLSFISSYFWFALLLIPARAFHLAWGTVIKPWLSSKNEGEQEGPIDEKKQKKMERRQKRYATLKS